jgi:hypothetical protein
MASILLANIPVDDSMDRKETKKIFEALDYVKAGIQHRSKHRGVYFCDGNVKLPDETFIHVLGFLDKRDLIDNISHVSYAWAKASLSPTVRRWQTIDCCYKPPTRINIGITLTNHTKIRKEELLLQMLQRRQFTLLKKLVVHLKLTVTLIEKIAKVCPRLKELRESGVIPTAVSTEIMHKLPTLFPELNRIGVLMETASRRQDAIRFVETIGTRLVELKVQAYSNLESGFTDDDIVIIGRHCPNLRSFSYSSFNVHSVMTERGLTALVDGCPKLEKLNLYGTCRLVDLEAYGYIALNAKNLRFLDVSGNWHYYLKSTGDWTGRNNDEAIRKHFAKRLESYKLFQYSLSPLP